MSARQRAAAEWSRTQEVVEGRSPVESFNDRSLELLTAAARLYSLGGAVLLVWLCPFLVVWLGLVGWLILAGHGLLTAAAAWWGWWEYGNDGWRTKRARGEG